jgi:hypothetical protein
MTEIQNSKPSHHLKKKNFKYVWVIEYLPCGMPPLGGPPPEDSTG